MNIYSFAQEFLQWGVEISQSSLPDKACLYFWMSELEGVR